MKIANISTNQMDLTFSKRDAILSIEDLKLNNLTAIKLAQKNGKR